MSWLLTVGSCIVRSLRSSPISFGKLQRTHGLQLLQFRGDFLPVLVVAKRSFCSSFQQKSNMNSGKEISEPVKLSSRSNEVTYSSAPSDSDVAKNNRIVWVDLEMSGLDLDVHTVLEMACVVTDSNLNIVAEAANLVIHHSEDVIDNMTDWCKDSFGKSGLTEEVRNSQISLSAAEDVMLEFLKTHVNYKRSCLAGNTVYMDRTFLRKYMPAFDDYLHYRIIDVSSIKELSRRWFPATHYQQPRKQLSHRALSDIRESIRELAWYRANVFRSAH